MPLAVSLVVFRRFVGEAVFLLQLALAERGAYAAGWHLYVEEDYQIKKRSSSLTVTFKLSPSF
jgi:hypothetical protein